LKLSLFHLAHTSICLTVGLIHEVDPFTNFRNVLYLVRNKRNMGNLLILLNLHILGIFKIFYVILYNTQLIRFSSIYFHITCILGYRLTSSWRLVESNYSGPMSSSLHVAAAPYCIALLTYLLASQLLYPAGIVNHGLYL